jgi:hypothetical protein
MGWWRPVAVLLDELVCMAVARRCLWPGARLTSDPVLIEQTPLQLCHDLEAFYSPVKAVTLVPEGSPVKALTAGVCYQDYGFQSPIRCGFPEVNRGLVRRWWSEARDTGLSVLLLPGLAQFNFFWFDTFAEALASRGIEALMLIEPYNFRRTPRGYQPSQLIAGGPPQQLIAAFRYALVEARGLVEGLRASGRRVALVGQSFGAWISTMLAVLEWDLVAVLPATPMGDVVRWYYGNSTLARKGRRRVYLPDAERLRALAKPVNPIEWQPRTPRQRIHFHIAAHDRFLSPRLAIELARHWQVGYTLHDEGHCSIWLGSRFRRLLVSQVQELAGLSYRIPTPQP